MEHQYKTGRGQRRDCFPTGERYKGRDALIMFPATKSEREIRKTAACDNRKKYPAERDFYPVGIEAHFVSLPRDNSFASESRGKKCQCLPGALNKILKCSSS
ncbi:hypothetical protein GWI33_016307 [Rhynchophorus ferrugineus]|uniref:Uncharacterized protein n=1 Tax=Rhynchophorus ferrugineus TaxID=354439 RepID=A0A834I0B7_RHYFE|nr:hypothetical protein GWI33_016307 [Rhynchophorus ferrugineus]